MKRTLKSYLFFSLLTSLLTLPALLETSVAQAQQLAVERGGGITVLSGVPEAPTGLKAEFKTLPVLESFNDGNSAGYRTVLKPMVWLTWNSNVGMESIQYVVYRNSMNDFTGITAVSTTPAGATSYADMLGTVTATTTYYYKVAGKNSRGEGYNSDVAMVTVTPATNVVEAGSGSVGRKVEERPVGSGIIDGTVVVAPGKSWINFDKLPGENVALPAGSRINFGYSWTNKLPKGKTKTVNRKFVIRRRLWRANGDKVLEKSAVVTIYPGQPYRYTVNELLKEGRVNLSAGSYTMQVEILHYIPYNDEADLVVDTNSFNLNISNP